MKILITGKNGQVGWELKRTLAPLGNVIALGRQDLDLTDIKAIRNAVRSIKPDLIINAAAYTAVDKAEEEADIAMAVNGIAPGILAEEAVFCKAPLIHYSTDYVFDGTKNEPYTENDKPNPVNFYGKTKLVGEEAVRITGVPHLIFRLSWVYGLRGQNFLLTILRLAQEKEELNIIKDQFGSPTWSRMIAEVTAQIVCFDRSIKLMQGLYHLAATGETSWYDFADAIIRIALPANIEKLRLNAVSTAEYDMKILRPKYSVLDSSALFEAIGLRLPQWQVSLNDVFER